MSMGTNTSYLVTIQQYGQPGVGTAVTSITAPIPESVSFDVSAAYETLLPQSFTKNGLINGAAAMMGMKLAVQSMTAQLWTGSTTGDLSFNLEFYTETDPDADVRTPVLNLMKLVVPTINKYGLMQSPGPQLDLTALGSVLGDTITSGVNSVSAVSSGIVSATKNVASGAISAFTGQTATPATMSNGSTTTTDTPATSTTSGNTTGGTNPQLGTAAYWKSLISNRIQIRIGNYLFFDNVIITHVGNVFTSNFDAVTGLPHHVIVSVSFRPMFTLVQSDLDQIFLTSGSSTGSTTSGVDSYGFSIPGTSTAGVGSNVYNFS